MRLWIKGWDVINVLVFHHSLGNVAAESFNLFANITKGDIAGPLSNNHNGVNRYVIQIHCNYCTTANGICANVKSD